MHKAYILMGLGLALAACTGDASADPLHQPPFAAITDSIERTDAPDSLLYERSVRLYRGGEKALARKDAEQAWALRKRETYALSLARLLGEVSPDSAQRFLASAITVLPESVAIPLAAVRLRHAAKDYTGAGKAVDALLERHPGAVDAWLLRAEILDSLQRTEAATQSVERAYALLPGDVEIVHALALRYADGRHPRTLALCDSLIAADVGGRHAEPWLFKGIYYYNGKAYAQAKAAINEAIVRDYNYLDAHMYKGSILFEEKAYDAAYKSFQLAATITPSFADAWLWMGKCDEIRGRKDAAKENYKRAEVLARAGR